MRGISWIAESLLASQKGLCSMELGIHISYHVSIPVFICVSPFYNCTDCCLDVSAFDFRSDQKTFLFSKRTQTPVHCVSLCFSPGIKAAGAWCWPLHLVLSLGMSGTMPTLPLIFLLSANRDSLILLHNIIKVAPLHLTFMNPCIVIQLWK